MATLPGIMIKKEVININLVDNIPSMHLLLVVSHDVKEIFILVQIVTKVRSATKIATVIQVRNTAATSTAHLRPVNTIPPPPVKTAVTPVRKTNIVIRFVCMFKFPQINKKCETPVTYVWFFRINPRLITAVVLVLTNQVIG